MPELVREGFTGARPQQVGASRKITELNSETSFNRTEFPCTGEVRNLEEIPQQKPYLFGVKRPFIFRVYHSLRIYGHKPESFAAYSPRFMP